MICKCIIDETLSPTAGKGRPGEVFIGGCLSVYLKEDQVLEKREMLPKSIKKYSWSLASKKEIKFYNTCLKLEKI